MALALTLAIAAAPATPPLAFHVAVPERDGFVDATSGILDSVHDLVRMIRARDLAAVPEVAQADLLVTILGRDVGSQRFGELMNLSALQTRYGTSIIATSVPVFQNDYWVAALLEAGPLYKKVFVGRASNTSRYSMGAWTKCAEAIVDELVAWTKANREQIERLRHAKQ
jgi:hypothetical protein